MLLDWIWKLISVLGAAVALTVPVCTEYGWRGGSQAELRAPSHNSALAHTSGTLQSSCTYHRVPQSTSISSLMSHHLEQGGCGHNKEKHVNIAVVFFLVEGKEPCSRGNMARSDGWLQDTIPRTASQHAGCRQRITL